MEKLQPVIKQIFWICFGFALIFLLIGWWSANGALSTDIETRTTAVNKAITDAGQNVSSVPNNDWTTAAKVVNEKHKGDFDKSANGLYQEQLKARVYPRAIRSELDLYKFNSTIPDKALRERFAQLYEAYFNEQFKVIKPYIDGEGLVDISNISISAKQDASKWIRRRPTSAEIWKAQEDIWLIRSLLDSIAAVNGSAERIDKAPLRALTVIQLRGGDREAPIGGGGGGGGMGMGGMEGGEGYGGGYGGGGGFGAMGGSGATSSGAWQAYEGSLASDLLNEELGAVSGGGGGGGMSGMGMMGGGEEYGSGTPPGFGGGGTTEEEEDRYVDDDENLPYRTRAFMLNVKLVQTEIPALLAELTNSSFPVEILRVDAGFTGGGAVASGAFGGGEMGGGYGSGEGGYGSGESSGAGGFGGSPGFGGFGTSGMGAPGGMSAPGGPGGFGGSPGMGMGSSGMGSSGMGASGIGSSGMGASGVGGNSRTSVLGQRLLAAAMADPAIATVRVAGLMTMYRSRVENEAEAAAEAAEASEAQETGGVDLTQPVGPDAVGDDPEIEDSETSTDEDLATEPGASSAGSDTPIEPAFGSPAGAETKPPQEDAGSQPASTDPSAAENGVAEPVAPGQ